MVLQGSEKSFCSHCKIPGHTLEKCFKANPTLEKPMCTHCHMVGHTAEHCFKLHGYPTGHKLSTRGKALDSFANQVSFSNQEQINKDSQSGLTKEQYQHLLTLLQSKASQPSVTQVQIDSTPSCHSALTMTDEADGTTSLHSIDVLLDCLCDLDDNGIGPIGNLKACFKTEGEVSSRSLRLFEWAAYFYQFMGVLWSFFQIYCYQSAKA
ncbi:hypothetical protein F0562_027643 [Nyssa sinensis]|uniref:Uncharacterized protein n=1 Tax=Nyssa sinensis TaxID=561372 RepID=A0A5J5B7N3_9ASTE|nr:hypothetical protein F0562_027643 [Nyssa sinensis]